MPWSRLRNCRSLNFIATCRMGARLERHRAGPCQFEDTPAACITSGRFSKPPKRSERGSIGVEKQDADHNRDFLISARAKTQKTSVAASQFQNGRAILI